MKKIYILLLGIILYANSAISQENPPKLLIMGVPQYMVRQGIRIDFELPTKDYNSWWVFSPVYFINVSDLGNDERRDYEQMHGYGLSIGRKGFLSRKSLDKGVYISGNAGFHYYNFLANISRWHEIEIDGLKYQEYVTSNSHVYVNKFLIDALVGYQKEIYSRLYLDFYAGIGLRYSFHEGPSGSNVKFNKNVFDYGYTGTLFVGGFRLGIGL
jgi:hypothetical protein